MANKRNSDTETGRASAAVPQSGRPAENRKKFEDELADLETIVAQIDSGELSLEESSGAFERGVSLVRSLNQKLDEVERRVEVLIRSAQGELKTTPFEAEIGGKENSKDDEDDVPF
jgi:exodeoxyribonuclease VII small subunit